LTAKQSWGKILRDEKNPIECTIKIMDIPLFKKDITRSFSSHKRLLSKRINRIKKSLIFYKDNINSTRSGGTSALSVPV
jgi:hypothetical protein